MFNWCWFHKYELVGVIRSKEQWVHRYSNGTHIPGSEYPRTLYEAKYKCMYCDKIKFRAVHADEVNDSLVAEFEFWLNDHKDDTKDVKNVSNQG
jgi:hypothetical protein